MTADYSESVALLAEVAAVDQSIAQETLKRFDNNIERATDYLLTSTGVSDPVYSIPPANESTDSMPALISNDENVIDLTHEENDIDQAMRMSVDIQQPQPQYAPDKWALVPSNKPPAQDDSLDQAIARSLQDVANQAKDEEIPTDIPPRQDGRPVALWPKRQQLVYIALVLHALFHVPQVTSTFAKLEIPSDPNDVLYKTQQLFATMDIVLQSILPDHDESFTIFSDKFLEKDECPGHKSKDFLVTFGRILGERFPETQRLMNFAHATIIQNSELPDQIRKNPSIGCIVLLPRTPSASPEVDPHMLDIKTSSLMTGLLNRITTEESEDVVRIEHDVIHEPSDVIGFHIVNPGHPVDFEHSQRFTYPIRFYLDPFLLDNLEIAKDRRTERGQMIQEISRLVRRRASLVEFADQTLPSLRTSIYYFQNVSGKPSHEERRQEISTQLQTACSHIEQTIAETEERLAYVRQQAADIFNEPELQKHPYDLRAVLMHTGDFGRKQIYSYVQDEKQRWWKTVGREVTEVSESDMLEDDTGLKKGAGPYLLLYSKAISPLEVHQPVSWPSEFQDAVEENNRTQDLLQPDIRPQTPERPHRPPPQSSTTRKLPTPKTS